MLDKNDAELPYPQSQDANVACLLPGKMRKNSASSLKAQIKSKIVFTGFELMAGIRTRSVAEWFFMTLGRLHQASVWQQLLKSSRGLLHAAVRKFVSNYDLDERKAKQKFCVNEESVGGTVYLLGFMSQSHLVKMRTYLSIWLSNSSGKRRWEALS
jgi:hypothetical protein